MTGPIGDARCHQCGALVTLNADASLRVHGPTANRCRGSRGYAYELLCVFDQGLRS